MYAIRAELDAWSRTHRRTGKQLSANRWLKIYAACVTVLFLLLFILAVVHWVAAH